MDYKIVFQNDVDSVTKENIEKIGLGDLFKDYDGTKISFLNLITNLYNNDWKVSKIANNSSSVSAECYSNIYPNKLILEFSNDIIDKVSYEQTMEIIKKMSDEVIPEKKDTNDTIDINNYLTDSIEKKEDNLYNVKGTKYLKSCNKESLKNKIALYEITGSFMAVIN